MREGAKMSEQRTLITDEADEQHLPAVIEHPSSIPESSALVDLRARAMSVPTPVMQQALAEYSDRRRTFRSWLKSQLIEGVHFGFPPGCEPRPSNETQWKSKPSLYKAGSEFVCDLMGVRTEYEADRLGWEQAGSKPGMFIYICRLYSRSTNELIGEGRGCYSIGYKKMADNAIIKMAEKSARVDAVLNAYGLSDLFTQDIDDDPPAPPDITPPAQKKDAPKAAPRGQRTEVEIATENQRLLKELFKKFKDTRTPERATPSELSMFVCIALGHKKADVTSLSCWTTEEIQKCIDAIEVHDD